MVTSLLTLGTAVSNSSAARTTQSWGKFIFKLVLDVANSKFAKRVRPVCTPGLPYRDLFVYMVCYWRIFYTLLPRFYTPLAHFLVFSILNCTYTLSMFQICFPTFKLRLIVRKHIILYLERVSPGFACFGNNNFLKFRQVTQLSSALASLLPA
jgi:hypothetical protein